MYCSEFHIKTSNVDVDYIKILTTIGVGYFFEIIVN